MPWVDRMSAEGSKDKGFPKGIEVVGSVIIENDEGEVLLTKSRVWGEKWAMPGGHVEPGEGLIESQVREGKEETGLDLVPVEIVSWGELIGSSDFHRRAHFVYFDVYCRTATKSVRLRGGELLEFRWVRPEEALGMDLAESYDRVLRDFIRYKRSEKES